MTSHTIGADIAHQPIARQGIAHRNAGPDALREPILSDVVGAMARAGLTHFAMVNPPLWRVIRQDLQYQGAAYLAVIIRATTGAEGGLQRLDRIALFASSAPRRDFAASRPLGPREFDDLARTWVRLVRPEEIETFGAMRGLLREVLDRPDRGRGG